MQPLTKQQSDVRRLIETMRQLVNQKFEALRMGRLLEAVEYDHEVERISCKIGW